MSFIKEIFGDDINPAFIMFIIGICIGLIAFLIIIGIFIGISILNGSVAVNAWLQYATASAIGLSSIVIIIKPIKYIINEVQENQYNGWLDFLTFFQQY